MKASAATICRTDYIILKPLSVKTKVKIFKVIGGAISQSFDLQAFSDEHAVTVAEDFYKSMGFVGRWYCETSNGYNFLINN